jgi:hypothetical protein
MELKCCYFIFKADVDEFLDMQMLRFIPLNSMFAQRYDKQARLGQANIKVA